MIDETGRNWILSRKLCRGKFSGWRLPRRVAGLKSCRIICFTMVAKEQGAGMNSVWVYHAYGQTWTSVAAVQYGYRCFSSPRYYKPSPCAAAS